MIPVVGAQHLNAMSEHHLCQHVVVDESWDSPATASSSTHLIWRQQHDVLLSTCSKRVVVYIYIYIHADMSHAHKHKLIN